MPINGADQLNELGVSLDLGSISTCSNLQLVSLSQELEENSKFNALKRIVAEKNIKRIKLIDEEMQYFNCEIAVINNHTLEFDNTCDPSSNEGKLVDLKQTEVKISESTLSLKTNSQMENNVIKTFSIKSLDPEEMDSLVSLFIVENEDKKEYLSLTKIQEYSIAFDISSTLSYEDQTLCGKVVTVDNIITKINQK